MRRFDWLSAWVIVKSQKFMNIKINTWTCYILYDKYTRFFKLWLGKKIYIILKITLNVILLKAVATYYIFYYFIVFRLIDCLSQLCSQMLDIKNYWHSDSFGGFVLFLNILIDIVEDYKIIIRWTILYGCFLEDTDNSIVPNLVLFLL